MKRKSGRPAGTFKNQVRTDSPEYRAWSSMRQRCNNPNAHNWRFYGGRGITVCEQWNYSAGFSQFYADLGPCNGLTLDRIDNDGNYEPANCRWTTMQSQADNRRPCGPHKPDSLHNKAKIAGLPYCQVYFRIHRLGWTEERALSMPIQPRGRPVGWRKPVT